MKKFLLSLGLISALTIAGCSQSDNEDDTATGDDTAEQQEEDTKSDESNDNAEVKKELLNAQMDFTSTVSPYQQKINAYQGNLADEEVSEEDIEASAEEALTAAKDAQTELENYQFEADVPDEVKENYQQAIATLGDYYSETETAINDSALEPDFSAAQDKWDEFQEQITSIYEGQDMFAPNMADALS
ncbi:hypothetical protein [Virgibacillus senegalensis]|uniref:hypothetical protein n=1 Tax=Virgibacillus senegalensis TaxID=1499679 RepID=UPI00069FBC51|nr:hypothetical protein [Virgibacillus senegalensis]